MRMEKTNGRAEGANADIEPAAAPAPTIEQVRELLFGETKRTHDQRLVDLDAKMTAHFEALRADMSARFQAVEDKLAALDNETERKRLASIDDIGAAIAQLGASVRGLGAASPKAG